MTDLPDLLQRFWGICPDDLRPLSGGMNSQTWLVRHQGSTYVAKRVAPIETDRLLTGCEVAATLADAGFVTGRPVTTTDGRLVVTEHSLALLEHVAGRELQGDTDDEQRWIATTLAGVHATGNPGDGPSAAEFAVEWLSPQQAGVEAHSWLPRAIEAVRAETDQLTLTWSVLHTDPSPEAFIHDDESGVTGLIDWAGATRGPVLYDVASAVMYLAGPRRATAFLAAYQDRGPLERDEMVFLDAFRRFRWVVQAAYFARRLSAGDRTGIADDAENEKGLDDARRGLAGLGLDTA